MKPTFFRTPADFRAWFAKHHLAVPELLVGFYKKESGRASITWPESIDEALCAGWIDGVRRRIDDESYSIRFTPRRKGSIWSAINIRRVKVLTAEGRMLPAGLAAFNARTSKKSGIYSYEQRHRARLEPALDKQLRASQKAWTFFSAQPPGYRRQMIWWVATAKQPATRRTRLERLIKASAAGKRLR